MNWHLRPKAPEEFIRQFPEYPPLVLQLLYNRGIKIQKTIDEFFNPDYSQDLHNSFLLKGMEKAVKRIFKAIKKQEKIAIFADYDCDGICGAVILFTSLTNLGANLLKTYIPDRNQEGRGLNLEAIKKLKLQGTKLIITVDCGIANYKEIELAKSKDLEVIVVDHHQIVEKIPKTITIDPFQDNDKYPFKELAATGLAFKLVQALLKNRGVLPPYQGTGQAPYQGTGQALGRDQSLAKARTPEGFEKWLLDLVALATVADMMPLLGENRTLVKYGLIVLAQTKRIGLKKLMKVAGLVPSLDKRQLSTNLDAYALAFILGPRLNVASRIDQANIAYQLLITNSEQEAEILAYKLDKMNNQRQQMVEKIVKEIDLRIKKSGLKKIILEGSNTWPIGLLGLVASRLVEKYYRPTLIFNISQEEIKGSARTLPEKIDIIEAKSLPQFNIVEAISGCSQFLKQYGGHPAAAGCNLKSENLEKFKICLEKIAEQKLKEEDLVPILEIDYEMKPEEINWQIYEQIQSFAPFGQANPRPLFLLSDLEITDLRTVGNNGKHLKLELGIPAPKQAWYGASRNQELGTIKKIKAIGFNCGSKRQGFKIGDKCDIVFELITDEWNGTRSLQLKIIDIKKHEINSLH